MGKLMIGNNIVSPVIVNGSSQPYGKYQILQRISDDNGNEIGTVSGFYKDDNNINYAVVCLDAQYRLASGQCLSSRTAITDLPQYGSVATGEQWGYNCQSSTYNTQKILDYCTANNYTSSACTHCRSKSFTIDGITYYGQLPNIKELADIVTMRSSLESLDTSATSAGTTLNFSTWKNTFTSTQFNNTYMWIGLATGYNLYLTYGWKDDSNFIIPVLEIPNQDIVGNISLTFQSYGVPVIDSFMIDNTTYSIPYGNTITVSNLISNKTYSLKIGTSQNNVNINSTQVSSNSDTCSFIINGSNITFTGTSTYTTTIDTVIRLGTSLTCCIPYYTPVNYYNGSIKLAEEVRIGDKLLGYNESTQEFQEVEVLNIIHKLRNQIVKVITENHEIEITPDHPILTDKGWAVYDLNIGNYKEVDKIQLDTTLKVLTINGYENILSIECNTLNNAIDTYTFNTTDGVDTYVANDVVNHNVPEKCDVVPSKE